MYCAPGWSGGWPWGGWLLPGLLTLALLGVGLWLLLRCAQGKNSAPPRCPRCGGGIHEAYFRCPHCGETLKGNCPFCSRVVEQAWEYCPFCSRGLKQPQGVETAST